MGKWIEFKQIPFEGKTKKFGIITKETHECIGEIKWYGRWRKYSFFPEPNTVYETDCLTDIVNFIKDLMYDRKILERRNNE